MFPVSVRHAPWRWEGTEPPVRKRAILCEIGEDKGRNQTDSRGVTWGFLKHWFFKDHQTLMLWAV